MEFKELHADINCNCIADTFEDCESLYGMKTNYAKIRAADFKTKWEKGQKSSDCGLVCLLKGKSLSKVADDKIDTVKEIYRRLFPADIAPAYKPFFTVIKFKKDCGNLKNSPMTGNPFHHTFYKCDGFLHSNVELIETTILHSDV